MPRARSIPAAALAACAVLWSVAAPTMATAQDLVKARLAQNLGPISGLVIVEVAQEAVTNTADVKKRVDQIKKDGRKSILLMVANGEGELRFVPLLVQ